MTQTIPEIFQKAVEQFYACKLDTAEKYCNKILKQQPDQADVLHLLGVIAHRRNQQDKALAYIRKALEIHPLAASFRHSLGMILLLMGQFREGWQAYEWRLEVPAFRYRKLNRPYWNGEPLDGKSLLVLSEQGYGDTIQFMRYLTHINHGVDKIIFACPVPLLHLVPKIPNISLITSTITPVTKFDLHVSLLSLPHIFRTDLHNIPPPCNFFHVDEKLIHKWAKKIQSDNFRIGIVWAGRRSHENDLNRSCHLSDFAPLINIPNVQFYSLQKEWTEDELAKTPKGMALNLLGGGFANFSDTAAAITHLDLIITVDTAVAHLAATLGKETWILLPYVPDWRWLMDKSDTPWYSTVRLFRQEKIGDWKSLFQQVALALQQYLSTQNKVSQQGTTQTHN